MKFKEYWFRSLLLISFVFATKCLNYTSTEPESFTSSVASMEVLIDIEKRLIESLQGYAKDLQVKVDKLNNLTIFLSKENQKALWNPQIYLQNPLNGFSLVRRLHHDWPKIVLFMTDEVGGGHLNVIGQLKSQMPHSFDMEEAINVVDRLQFTYRLNISDMSKGLLNGKQYNATLKSIDQFCIAYNLFEKDKYKKSALWNDLAMLTYDEDMEYYEIIDYTKDQPYRLYAEILKKQLSPQEALLAIQQTLELRPLDEMLLKLENNMQLDFIRTQSVEQMTKKISNDLWQLGCLGLYTNNQLQHHCLYNTSSSPSSIIAPFKMEILNLDPFIAFYHDVISDDESKELIDACRPNLHRSAVDNTIKNYRLAKHDYLLDNDSETTIRLMSRLEDMTGLIVKNSEVLQLVNYGIGGHYYVHYDTFNITEDDIKQEGRDKFKFHLELGDRFATVLFYLSDVEQGGATIFPALNISVFPRKGSALVWYNLKNDMGPHPLTLHAACPVLVGSKWIITKWIQDKHQLFRRPCYK